MPATILREEGASSADLQRTLKELDAVLSGIVALLQARRPGRSEAPPFPRDPI